MIRPIARPTRLLTPTSLGGLLGVAATGFALALAVLLYVLYLETGERTRQRLDDLVRLTAAQIELRLNAAEPALVAMAGRAASMLVVEQPTAETRADVARQVAALLPRVRRGQRLHLSLGDRAGVVHAVHHHPADRLRRGSRRLRPRIDHQLGRGWRR